MLKITVYFVSLEVAGLLGFIITSSHQEGTPFRFLPLLIALVAIGYVAFSKARALSYKEATYLSITASASFILMVQFLSFTVYPGLSKDLEFFSGENAARTALMLLIGTVGPD